MNFLVAINNCVVMHEISWSFHYRQPASRWRLHRWLAKHDNPAMSPHALEKTGMYHTDIHCGKQRVGTGRNKKPLNAPQMVLIFPATLINKRYCPKQVEFHGCTSIPIPLGMTGHSQSTLFNWLNFI